MNKTVDAFAGGPLLSRRSTLALGSAFVLTGLTGFTGRASAATINISAPLSGQLGDKSFMDSANEGLQRAVKELGSPSKSSKPARMMPPPGSATSPKPPPAATTI